MRRSPAERTGRLSRFGFVIFSNPQWQKKRRAFARTLAARFDEGTIICRKPAIRPVRPGVFPFSGRLPPQSAAAHGRFSCLL